jgi:hypothetical protein
MEKMIGEILLSLPLVAVNSLHNEPTDTRLRSGVDDDDGGYLAADQIGREGRQPAVVVLRPAILDREVLVLDEAGLRETLANGSETQLGFFVAGRSSA